MPQRFLNVWSDYFPVYAPAVANVVAGIFKTNCCTLETAVAKNNFTIIKCKSCRPTVYAQRLRLSLGIGIFHFNQLFSTCKILLQKLCAPTVFLCEFSWFLVPVILRLLFCLSFLLLSAKKITLT